MAQKTQQFLSNMLHSADNGHLTLPNAALELLANYGLTH